MIITAGTVLFKQGVDFVMHFAKPLKEMVAIPGLEPGTPAL